MGGRTSTHVANAYHETVFVKVDAERSYVLSMNFSVSGEAEGVKGSASGGATWDWNKLGLLVYQMVLSNDLMLNLAEVKIQRT